LDPKKKLKGNSQNLPIFTSLGDGIRVRKIEKQVLKDGLNCMAAISPTYLALKTKTSYLR